MKNYISIKKKLIFCSLFVFSILLSYINDTVQVADQICEKYLICRNLTREQNNFKTIKSSNYYYEPFIHSCFNDNPYDTTQLPLLQKGQLIIRYQFGLNSLIELTAAGKFSFVCTIALYWIDLNRCWNDSEFPIYGINIPAREIWTPSLRLVNSRSNDFLFEVTNSSFVYIFSSGDVEFYGIKQFDASCHIELEEFPFDSQNCSIYFLIQNYASNEIVVATSEEVYQGFQFDADEWKIVRISDFAKNYSIDKYARQSDGSISKAPSETHDIFLPGFQIEVILKRNPGYYICNLVAPVVLMSILSFFAGLLQSDSGERLNLAVTVMLGFLFIQSGIAQFSPSSDHTPKIAFYVLGNTILAAFNVIASAVLMWIYSFSSPVPSLLEFIFVRILGRIFLVRSHFPAKTKSENLINKSNKFAHDSESQNTREITQTNVAALEKDLKPETNHPWKIVVGILNRFLSFIYLIISCLLVQLYLAPILF